MLLLGLLACGSAGAEEVAAVMVVSGDPAIRRAGAMLPARDGMALQAGDTLVTDEDDAIIVHLSNDHVVRIDSELELPLQGIVMRKAPKSDVPPGEQLAALLYEDELARIDSALLARAERVAGWHSRLTAADAYTGVAREEASASEAERDEEAAPPSPPPPPTRGLAPIDMPGGPGDGDARQIGEIAPQPAARPAPRPAAASDEGYGSSGSKRKPKVSKKGKKSPMAPPTSSAPPSLTTDDLARRFEGDGPLRQCLVDWADDLPVPIASLQITVLLDDAGRIVRLAADGGLFLPACAREIEKGQALDAAVDPPRFTVELD
jgi:hypothetical protein